MESIKLWARNGEAVRQAIELGEMAHLETASEELTDEFLLFGIESGLLKRWAEAFPDPRDEPEIGMEVILPAHIAARFAGLYSMPALVQSDGGHSVMGIAGQIGLYLSYVIDPINPKMRAMTWDCYDSSARYATLLIFNIIRPIPQRTMVAVSYTNVRPVRPLSLRQKNTLL